MARRFGRFNKNQKRDSKGRWTRGGASSSKSKSKASSRKKGPDYRTGRLSNGAILMSTKDPNKYTKRGSNIGGALGLAVGVVSGVPLAGVGLGVLGGAVIGNSIDQRIARRRINAAEAALRRRKR